MPSKRDVLDFLSRNELRLVSPCSRFRRRVHGCPMIARIAAGVGVVSFLIELAVATPAFARWTDGEIAKLTLEVQKRAASWRIEDTRKMLEGAANTGTTMQPVFTSDGPIMIQIMGKTVLIDGEDVTGRLGSKTTYGANSPIIGDVTESQVTTGDESPIPIKNYTFHLSIALTLSLATNLYLVARLRGLKRRTRT